MGRSITYMGKELTEYMYNEHIFEVFSRTTNTKAKGIIMINGTPITVQFKKDCTLRNVLNYTRCNNLLDLLYNKSNNILDIEFIQLQKNKNISTNRSINGIVKTLKTENKTLDINDNLLKRRLSKLLEKKYNDIHNWYCNIS